MPIAYTLKIDGQPDLAPSVNGHEHVVTRAIWTLTGTDGDLTASTSASTEFPAPTKETPFTAFEDLTEETVIGWVEANADPDYMQSRKDIIAAEIEKQRNPYTPPTAPWIEEAAPAEEEEA